MRKIFTLVLGLAFFANSFAGVNIAVAPIKPVKPGKVNAAEMYFAIGKNGEKVSLLDISRMSVKELQLITGNKMSNAEKVGFKVAQKQLRENIDNDGYVNNVKVNKLAAKAMDDGSGFHLGGFALGFLLGLIGVLIAYLIKDDKKSARTKWAWIGLAAGLVLYLIFFVAL